MVKAVVGANWGDEGKGKITDMLAKQADIIVRFQGGANAGHTIVNDYGKFALHTLPSGVFYSHTTSVIGNGVALDIPRLFKEIKSITDRNVPMPKILVSNRAQIVMPYHVLFDQYEEERLGGKSFGSTKSGIAPFYSDKYAKEQRDLNMLVDQIERISNGELTATTDISQESAYYEYSQKLTNIGQGMEKALETQMKGERMKIDLITNVSHDIKTPLTSIINYVAILKQSDIADPKIQGYLDILEAKAQRLKTLTEDVVEASKVSSGNISLEYMDVDLVEMIQQTEGEMAEKFEARNLKMIVNLPAEPAVVHVDGRRMWRVLENIFGNAAKYAMPGTRVYADLKLEEDTVDLSLKNVSEHQLNISADELTERFIRGDLSRSSEGSGLGLSIAQSLTTMQGGTFNLYLDGDLFRVNIRFPRVKKQ